MPKFFTYTLVAVIFFQIIFSFYYSSEIINQNNQLYQNQQEYQKLKIENQNLEKTFSDLSSIFYLNQEKQKYSLIDINEKITLK